MAKFAQSFPVPFVCAGSMLRLATLRPTATAPSTIQAPALASTRAGTGTLPLKGLGGVALIGELGLDGQVRPVRGILPMALAATKAGINKLIVPAANAARGSSRARHRRARSRDASPSD